MDTSVDLYGNEDGYGDSLVEDYHGDQSLYEFPEERDSMSLGDLWTYCIKSVLTEWYDITAYIILTSCLLRWLSSHRRIPRFLIHVAAALLGLYCMLGIMNWHSFYAFTYGVFGLTSLFFVDWILGKHRTTYVTISCLMMIIVVGEFQLHPAQWNRIRGCVMIMTLKLISLSKDIDDGIILRIPSVTQMLGYIFHTSTVIFGPWITFYDYYRSLEEVEDLLDPIWLVTITRTLMASTVCLIFSSCGIEWLLSDAEDYGVWLVAFRDAMIFRVSHYFICFHSECSSVAGGVKRSGRNRKGEEWDIGVVRPGKIELPRSLVEVVVHWNRPMHLWLKQYIFKIFVVRGKFLAVLATFIASAFLHGLSFRISSVLLSLGFYTSVEFSLRKKLASMFGACMEARSCHQCDHRHKESNPVVRLVNLSFSVIVLLHLAYLGVMFDYSPEDGMTMNHTLEKWAQLDFLSLWIFLFMSIVSLIV